MSEEPSYVTRDRTQKQIILDGHQKYVDWWLPIDVAGGSFMAPMSLLWFMQYLLKFEDEEWFDRWLNKDEFITPKDGNERMAKIYMKDFILKCILKHHMKWIDLHDKGNEFTELERDDEPKSELR